MQYMYIVISEGLGKISVKLKDSMINMDIFVKSDIKDKLNALLDIYKNHGIQVDSEIRPK